MYQNMTREEMIQRLYEGNFTTGELERQLIAKLFEQCCGGGSGSSGGGAFVVNASADAETEFVTLDKTAVEIFEALKIMPVILAADRADEDGNTVRMQIPISRAVKAESGGYYTFISSQVAGSGVVEQEYYAANDNDYPTNQDPTIPK